MSLGPTAPEHPATTAKVTRYVEQVMGMPVSLALRGPGSDGTGARRAWDAVVATLREVDRVFSTYRDDSYVSRLARRSIDVDRCPPEVREVLALAATARLESRGAFDVRWRRGDGPEVFDPSGVVKGWAVDRAARHLRHLADTAFCLSAGGDMVCSSTPGSEPWRIGVEDPGSPGRVIAVVPVWNGGLATSALTHRGPHIVDPRSGRTPTVLTSVTVVAPALTWADIDATAAFVLGDDAPHWLADRHRAGVLVWADGRTQTYGPDGLLASAVSDTPPPASSFPRRGSDEAEAADASGDGSPLGA